MAQRRPRRSSASTSWEPVAEWYAGWVGAKGSEYHRRLVIPVVLELLAPAPGEHILDIGAGTGVLAPHITKAGACYTGLDASRKLLAFARRHHGAHGRFLHGDATCLAAMPELHAGTFDAVVFMLSIQDMDPLDVVLASATWALRAGGRVVLLLTHPCFRVPRQSGWGWDAQRKLQYRRIDRYLTPLSVPMSPRTATQHGTTRSYHRPLEASINTLAACGLVVDQAREIPACQASSKGPSARAANLANQEIPLFLGLRAWKYTGL